MGTARPLTGAAEAARPRAARDTCPACRERLGAGTGVVAVTLGGLRVRRCARCGVRSDATGRILFNCDRCGAPDWIASPRAMRERTERTCGACRDGDVPEMPDAAFASAIEREVRRAITRVWDFVHAPALDTYLEAVAQRVAPSVGRDPHDVRIVLIDDWNARTLALPSGTVLLSLGMLASLRDEAELVFVLGHELAHASSRELALRLVRSGLFAATREVGPSGERAWSDAVLDLVRLGYGKKREREADDAAVDLVCTLGYDVRSVLRFLHRVDVRVARGESEIGELATAHARPEERAHRVEERLRDRAPGGAERHARTNREVFRRVCARDALARDLRPCLLDDPVAEVRERREEFRRNVKRTLWRAGAIVALAAGLIAMGFVLR